MIETFKQFDLQLFYLINQSISNVVFDFICPVLRDKRFLSLCYLVFGIVMYQSFPKQFLKIAAVGALTFLLTDQISSSLIKPYFQRLRPCNDHLVIVRLIIEHCGSGFSFVSSHAANSFGMATFLSVIFKERWAVTTLVIWATLVCFSQVYVGIHYPADVIAGGILGAVIGFATGLIAQKIIFTTTKFESNT